MADTAQSYGRYRVVERLAIGGMAELFLAEVRGQEGFQKRIVLKRLLPHIASDASLVSMFIDEAKITARLVHPKIAQTYELERIGGELVIAMEFVDGIDVLGLLRECAHRRSRVPAEISVFIVKETLDALDFAHGLIDESGAPLGIVHRDVSPSNILLSRLGNVKLVDFGIARASTNEHHTQAGTLKGKYGYMSPEQVVGNPVDARSDVFSAGIVLAEMLTGRRLFAAPNELDVLLMVRDAKLTRLDKYGADIEPSLDAILRRSLKKNLDERYQSAADLREALDEWMFEKRQRVGSRDIAQLVESLYADAWTRRREGMAQEVAARPASADLPEEGTGSRAPGSGMRSAPVSDVRSASSAVRGSSSAVRAPAGPSRNPDLSDASSRALDLALGPSGNANKSAPSRPSAPPTEARVPESQRRVSSPRLAPAPPTEEVDELALLAAALSPQAADPSATDFDDSQVQITGEPPRSRPKQLPSLDKLPARPASGAKLSAIDGDQPNAAGDLEVTAPIALLYQHSLARSTGLLVMTLGGTRKDIYFVDGTPEYVSSNVNRELFGEYLVRRGAISDGELAMSLAMMPHYGGKLGDTVVGLGLLKPLQVFRFLTEQVKEKLIDVCSWTKGNFAWFEGRSNSHEAFPLDLDLYEVLGAGAMELSEGYLRNWLEALSRRKPRSARNHRVVPEDFQLGAWFRAVYDSLDGAHTLMQSWQRYTDSGERVRFLRCVFLMSNTELVQWV